MPARGQPPCRPRRSNTLNTVVRSALVPLFGSPPISFSSWRGSYETPSAPVRFPSIGGGAGHAGVATRAAGAAADEEVPSPSLRQQEQQIKAAGGAGSGRCGGGGCGGGCGGTSGGGGGNGGGDGDEKPPTSKDTGVIFSPMSQTVTMPAAGSRVFRFWRSPTTPAPAARKPNRGAMGGRGALRNLAARLVGAPAPCGGVGSTGNTVSTGVGTGGGTAGHMDGHPVLEVYGISSPGSSSASPCFDSCSPGGSSHSSPGSSSPGSTALSGSPTVTSTAASIGTGGDGGDGGDERARGVTSQTTQTTPPSTATPTAVRSKGATPTPYPRAPTTTTAAAGPPPTPLPLSTQSPCTRLDANTVDGVAGVSSLHTTPTATPTSAQPAVSAPTVPPSPSRPACAWYDGGEGGLPSGATLRFEGAFHGAFGDARFGTGTGPGRRGTGRAAVGGGVSGGTTDDLTVLGRGRFGSVHRARMDIKVGAHIATVAVAVKCPRSGVGGAGEVGGAGGGLGGGELRALRELREESALQKRLHHPGIVQCFGHTSIGSGGRWGIVLELMEVGSLLDFLRTHAGQVAWSTKLMWAAHAAAGLAFLHREVRRRV